MSASLNLHPALLAFNYGSPTAEEPQPLDVFAKDLLAAAPASENRYARAFHYTISQECYRRFFNHFATQPDSPLRHVQYADYCRSKLFLFLRPLFVCVADQVHDHLFDAMLADFVQGVPARTARALSQFDFDGLLVDWASVCQKHKDKRNDLLNSLSELLRALASYLPDGGGLRSAVGCQPGVAVFPTPPGTDWEDVEISFLSKDRAQLKVSHTTEIRDYAAMGFEDIRTGNPIKAWAVLRLLGWSQASGNSINKVLMGADWEVAKKHIQTIRRKVRTVFGLPGDPVPFVRGRGFRARFRISSQ